MSDKYPDLYDLPYPADMEEHELVGLYMEVYNRYVQVSREVTKRITGDLDQNARLDKLAAAFEQPLEKWIDTANDYLPEWFDPKLLNYPSD